MRHLLKHLVAFTVAANAACGSALETQVRNNPTITGWHSDPSCVFVAEKENTTFCTASTFLLTPGLPVYASKDLTNWKLASHALSRERQFSEFNLSLAQSDGIWAPTI
jgi:beta-xylosidase